MKTPMRLLLDSILATFAATTAPDDARRDAVARTEAILASLDLSGLDEIQDERTFAGLHQLDVPLMQMREDGRADLANLANAIEAANLHLLWQVAYAYYYPRGVNPGPGYLSSNMSCELIGPEGAPVYAPDFRLGLFYFGPYVLYRDHAHLAPELYVTLAGPSHWRQDCEDWMEKPAGEMMFNSSNQAHAMQSEAMPFFSIFVWLSDVNEKIALVPMEDWAWIEGELAQKPN